MADRRHIAIIGAGLMGHGIALIFARAGHQVSLHDPSSDMLSTAPKRIEASMVGLGSDPAAIESALANVTLVEDLADAVGRADVVFEAAPEKLDLKKKIFSDLEALAPASAILASNTSVIQISKIMEHLDTRHRALGTHWWNPPHMIPLVEVVKTEWADPASADDIFGLLASVGKTPVMVEKDVPGFIGNRLQHALWREAVSLVENGICSAEAVDDVVKASFGRRLAVLGPLENADLVGIELTQDIHHQVLYDLDRSESPSPYLQHLLDDGRTGMAAGAGFRTWSEGDVERVKARIAAHLNALEDILPKPDRTHVEEGDT